MVRQAPYRGYYWIIFCVIVSTSRPFIRVPDLFYHPTVGRLA